MTSICILADISLTFKIMRDIKIMRFDSFFVCLSSILFAFFVLLIQALVQNLFIKCPNNCQHKGDPNVNNDSRKIIGNNVADKTSVRQLAEIGTIY